MVLPFYDFLLTLGGETDLFWRKRVTGASILFFASRYMTVIEFTRSVVVSYVTGM